MKPAAIQASLVDMRNVGAHKSLRLTLHIPEEYALSAIEAFGWPTGAHPVCVAIARLNQGKEGNATDTPIHQPPETSPASDSSRVPARAKFVDKLYAEQSGILCNDPKFWTFLRETHPTAHDVKDKDICAEWVRFYCNVQSRSEIRPSTVAGTRWELLVSAFRVWDLAPSVGAA